MNTNKPLKPYQRDVLNKIVNLIDVVIAEMPTGSGKHIVLEETILILEKKLQNRNKRY